MNINIVILAAGLGTRMKSRRAKVLHRAGGLPLIEHAVRTARQLTAPEKILAVIGYQADEVRTLMQPTGIRFAEQKQQRGTGHAVACCRDLLWKEDGLVIVMYGDGPLLSAATLKGLIQTQQQSDAAAALIVARMEDPTGYGRVFVDATGAVAEIVEERACKPEQRKNQNANMGIYCFRADLLWKHIGEITTNNPAGEFYLTDMAEILRRAGHRVEPYFAADPTELLGINTREELAHADRLLRERKARELMLAGVTIEQPETTSIDADVEVGMDSIIEPHARLLGKTLVGENCVIGAGAILENARLADSVTIAPYTLVADSSLEADTKIGPFARLRMESHVESGARIGNFVELKKTRLGAKAKSMHLAYLGDSEVGAESNVGAGTITCNYDGRAKHRTKIGRRAFIGSNSTLVAPLDIGEESYVGAGSVITDPVEPGALALGRGRQVVKPGWVDKRKKQ
jgi:bifunctional UDP-N-acetylglucosamine pyrophosphorylase/glucosamine-1-phosphate N-acetyltransferase